MKNLSLAFNVVLLLLVGILFFMYFSLKSNLSKEITGTTSVSNVATGDNGKSLRIAFINDDSISAKYTYMRKLSAEMQQRQQALQDDYEVKGRKLQQEYADYQQKMQSGNISQIDAQKAQKDMEQKKAALDDLQRQQEELVKEAEDKNQKISQKVIDFVNQYNKARHFDYILTYSSTHGPLIVTNPMLDVTTDIVNGLNKESSDSTGTSPAKR